MTHEHMKRCTSCLVIRETENENLIRYQNTSWNGYREKKLMKSSILQDLKEQELGMQNGMTTLGNSLAVAFF